MWGRDFSPGRGTRRLPERPHRAASLPAHLERVANRLTLLRGDPRNDEEMETALAAAVLQMDAHRQAARGARGPARAALIAHLESLDDSLLARVRAGLSPEQLDELRREAAETLAPFRERMPRAAYEAAHEAALTRLLREHAGPACDPVRCGEVIALAATVTAAMAGNAVERGRRVATS